MSSAAWQFKPREIRRAIKSVQSAGLEVSQVEVGRHGQITINVTRPCAPAGSARPATQQADIDARGCER